MNFKHFKYLSAAAIISGLTLGLSSSLNASVTRELATSESAVSQEIAQATRHPAVYTENGVALDGQDVVAYFTQSALVEGSQQYTHRWQGTKWLFSSAANRDLFAQSPEKYAPQYGGYCSKAAAGGVLATTLPTAWEVRDGKLYLNYSAAAQQEWRQDTASKIVQANANWPTILNNETLKQ
ncbi:MAG: YHS domain-containing protein [Drouetiella hepatica Uher 2000/2452]|jgi:YHS domain-containing protein|uniref:YHS domain-containing protein n=1 Tax=Drouetiella hepatica Uher 2000/2452 TaxID=904376 RepID=A0A951QCD9_9CYAN|nr:YHS domain-containing protein [Drouetiella hepatica Uher 2000/2452]